LLDRIAAARAKGTQAIRYRLAVLERRLRQRGIESALGALHRRVGRGLQRVDDREYRLRERIRAMLDTRARARRALEARLQGCDVRLRLARSRGALDRLTGQLSTLSPLRILERGYAIVSGESGILKDASAAPPDSAIHVRLAKGELDAVVRRSSQ
jgi:exodeoxyribonuclease VII large subunit